MDNSLEFEISGICTLLLTYHRDSKVSKLKAVEFKLEISKNLDPCYYLDEEGLPTLEGIKCLTNIFTQGLIANLHNAHQKGLWNDAEHLIFIMKELERGFIENVDLDLDE